MAVSRGRAAETAGGDRETRAGYLAKIARLYHLQEMGQREIAERLNVSAASVCRALARARQLGIVRITIDESPASSNAELEIEVERRFGLRECLLAPSLETPEETLRALAAEMGSLLPRLLRSGGALGLSWGETLKGIGESLPAMPSVRADVVPIIGAMGRIETGVYPNSIARTFADKLGGNAWLINTPAIVDAPAVRASVMADSNFASVRRLWRHLSAVVLGVSGLDADTSMSRGGIFTRSELSRMRAAGGACATNLIVLDAEGRPVRTAFSERIVNLTLEEMRDVPTVVIVAAGRAKAEPLRAALAGGFAHVLVTDAACAHALVEIPPGAPRGAPAARRSRRGAP